MLLRRFIVAASIPLLLIASSAAAQSGTSSGSSGSAAVATGGPATQYVREKAGEVIAIVNGVRDRDERLTQLKAKTRELLDFPMLSERTLGRHWDARSDAEKREFIGLMQELIETSYATEIGNQRLNDDDYRVQFIDERERRGNYTVDSIVEVDGDAKYVSVRLVQDGNNWKIYDVVTDDVSLVESYAESFDEIISEHGWGELIARIKKRIEELKAKQ